MILLFDQKQQFITEIGKDDIVEAVQDHKLNGLWQASVTMRLKDWTPYKAAACYFGYLVQDIFYLYKITKAKANDQKMALSGVHIFFDELQGRTIKDKRPSNVTSQFLADLILKGTGWRAVATASGSRSMSFYYISAAKAFENMIHAFSCDYRMEIKLSGGKMIDKVVYIADSISKDYGKWYEYGDRLLKIMEEEDRKSVFTAVIGRGKALQTEAGGYGRKINFEQVEWKKSQGKPVDKPFGQEYVELPEATEVFGYADGSPRIVIKEFPDIEDPEQLLQASYEYALTVSHPRLLLQASAIPEEEVKLGEIVAIIRPDMDIRYKTKVVEVKTNLLTGISDITIGDRSQISLVQAISNLSKTQTADKLEVFSWIEAVQKALTHDFFNEDGFNYELKADNPYHLPAGYYSFNAPIDKNPTKVIYFGAGKMAVSNKKDSSGNWIWSTWATGDGFTADLMRAGTIRGGNAYWNLETGELNLGGDFSYSPGTGLVITGSAKDQLKGEKGDRGETGSPGKDGAGGAPGIPGKDGLPGKDGKDGLPGKDGKDGSPGRGVARIVQEYVTTDENDASAPSGGWVSSPPREITGKTVWRRLATTFSDGSLSYTTPERLTDQQIVQAQLEAYRHMDLMGDLLLSNIAKADYADKAYIDGVLDEREQAQIEEIQRQIDSLRDALQTDSERLVAEKIAAVESRLNNLEGFIWMEGNVIYIGQKNHYQALQLTNKQVSLLERNRVRAYLNQQTLSAEQVKAYQLEFRSDGDNSDPLYQWRTRRVGGVDHLTLYHVGK